MWELQLGLIVMYKYIYMYIMWGRRRRGAPPPVGGEARAKG